jgi:hypothetical protein
LEVDRACADALAYRAELGKRTLRVVDPGGSGVEALKTTVSAESREENGWRTAKQPQAKRRNARHIHREASRHSFRIGTKTSPTHPLRVAFPVQTCSFAQRPAVEIILTPISTLHEPPALRHPQPTHRGIPELQDVVQRVTHQIKEDLLLSSAILFRVTRSELDPLDPPPCRAYSRGAALSGRLY